MIPFQNQTFYHAKKRKMCSDKIDTEEMVKIMFHYLRLLLCLEGKNSSSLFGKSEILQKNVILFVYCSECKTNLIIIFNGLCVLVISNQIHFMKHTLLYKTTAFCWMKIANIWSSPRIKTKYFKMYSSFLIYHLHFNFVFEPILFINSEHTFFLKSIIRCHQIGDTLSYGVQQQRKIRRQKLSTFLFFYMPPPP